MKISLYQPLSIHEIGQRTNQEDAIWPLQPTACNQLFVLCDGMGGHEHGEVASQTVSQAFGKWYQSVASQPINKQQVEEGLAYAYSKIDEKDNGGFRKMGTTLTFLHIGNNGIIAAHMGDSRIYHIRPNAGILYQSRDHSLVFDLFQAGEITYEEMNNFNQKNVVTRAMTPGEDNRMKADIIHISDIEPGDYFYMCSDGMLEQMSNEELALLFSSNISDEEKRKQLIEATTNNQDNHSAWLIHIMDVEHEADETLFVNEEATARCNAINIIPKVKKVEVAEEDDVVIVSAPKMPTSRKKSRKLANNLIMAISIILALIIGWFFFLRKAEKAEPETKVPHAERPKAQPMKKAIATPKRMAIKKSETTKEDTLKKDTLKKDSNQIKRNEPTRNK